MKQLEANDMTLNRRRLAYTLATHLCYGGVQPDDKAIDVLLERWDSYTPAKERQRQEDLAEQQTEHEGASL